jgi:hypothetical protein
LLTLPIVTSQPIDQQHHRLFSSLADGLLEVRNAGYHFHRRLWTILVPARNFGTLTVDSQRD